MFYKLFYINLLIIFSVLLLNLFNPHIVKADQIIFQDDFNDMNYTNNNWNVNNYILEDSGTFASIGQLNLEQLNNEIKISGSGTLGIINVDGQSVGNIGKAFVLNNTMPINDNLVVQADVKIENITRDYEMVIIIEFDSDNRIAFGLTNSISGKTIELALDELNNIRCTVDNENDSGCHTKYYDFKDGDYYNLKVTFDTNTQEVKGYINNIEEVWGIYHGLVINPRVGIATTIFGTYFTVDSRFDNFKVTTNISTPKLLDVPDIKQFTEPWGSKEYDFATSWYPSNPYISRWGCAMTSASMILNYHGASTNPEQLNTWLSKNKGYSRNGGVLWPAISKYSKDDPNTPTLEFNYLGYSDDTVKDETENNRPVILKLNNKFGGYHFIVGKGFDENNIYVNDPGKTGNNTLQQANSYWGSSVQIGQLKPSNSDLSYIVLFVDDGFSLKVSSQSGDIVGNNFYFKEGPMADPANPDSNGDVETLNAFYLPKPESGNYNVQIIGDGVYQMDIYTYDMQGNLKTGTVFGNGSQYDSNNIDFDKLDSQKNLVPNSSFQSFLTDWNNAYNNGQIYSYGLYNSVKTLIVNTVKLLDKNEYDSAKELINNAKVKIENANSIRMDNETSALFARELDYLLTKI